jgi:hypothetical protein
MLCASLGFESGSGSRFLGMGRFITEQSIKQRMLVKAASVRYRTAEIRGP